MLTPSNGVAIQDRATAGALAQNLASLAGAPVIYLRNARSGTDFSAYTSVDGVTWSTIAGSTLDPRPDMTQSCPASPSAHNNDALSTAAFDTATML